MRKPWFYHGVRWFYQLFICYSQKPINRNTVYGSVASATVNERSVSNSNVLSNDRFGVWDRCRICRCCRLNITDVETAADVWNVTLTERSALASQWHTVAIQLMTSAAWCEQWCRLETKTTLNYVDRLHRGSVWRTWLDHRVYIYNWRLFRVACFLGTEVLCTAQEAGVNGCAAASKLTLGMRIDKRGSAGTCRVFFTAAS